MSLQCSQSNTVYNDWWLRHWHLETLHLIVEKKDMHTLKKPKNILEATKGLLKFVNLISEILTDKQNYLLYKQRLKHPKVAKLQWNYRQTDGQNINIIDAHL